VATYINPPVFSDKGPRFVDVHFPGGGENKSLVYSFENYFITGHYAKPFTILNQLGVNRTQGGVQEVFAILGGEVYL
jgi:hypothetical protein